MTQAKPILVLDFDGVIHSYSSGWRGASNIPDPPVPGALDFIIRALDTFEVHILSSRSHQWGGKRAMRRWLHKHLREYWWTKVWPGINETSFEPHADAFDWATAIIAEIHWPWFKPAAKITIDDRALTFSGTWPELSALHAFRPWNGQPK